VNFAGPKPTVGTSASAQTADLTIVGGGGHVGIPLVLAFAEAGFRVNVHDINRDVLKTLQSGRLPFIEYGGEALLARALERDRLVFTSSPADISVAGPVIITIGTPIDEFHNPIRRAVQDCIDALLPHLVDGQLLVLRSTVSPGTTEWLDGYLKSKGRDLKLAFCPERMVQGHGIKELKETPQIVSGTSPDAEQEAGKLFSAITPELVVVNPKEAEFAKLFNNAYRYIEFATTNEFSDRQGRRRRLPAHLRRDAPQLSTRERHSRTGFRRRPLPDEGYDAACRLCAEPVQPRQRRDAGQRGSGAARLRRPGAALRPGADDDRAARHGLQGRHRRHPRFPELQVQEGARELLASRADDRSVRHHRPRSASA
jgi:3-hydroxyisobutyrate dehydrogenase-like beta-hydroxyacid dehydrogenase